MNEHELLYFHYLFTILAHNIFKKNTGKLKSNLFLLKLLCLYFLFIVENTGIRRVAQLEINQFSLGLFPCLQLLLTGGFGYRILIMFIFLVLFLVWLLFFSSSFFPSFFICLSILFSVITNVCLQLVLFQNHSAFM